MYREDQDIDIKFTNDSKSKACIKHNVCITINHNIEHETILIKNFLSKKATKKHQILKYEYDEFRLRNIEQLKMKIKISKMYGIKKKYIKLYNSYKYYDNFGIEIEYISLINLEGEGVLQKIRKQKIKNILEWV